MSTAIGGLKVPEMWGGVECTINRVNDEYADQLHLAQVYENPHWIKDIIALGIKALRFPILWEKHQPCLNKAIQWEFTENILKELTEKNVTPVAGLLHHGSGPAFTNLLDPLFPELFAKYAFQVAKKFPKLKYYTPVNEPLTTARFSGLYGFWYPHKRNDVSFVKILLNQLKATVLAMREIRKINPLAQLVQTEDLGKTYSTPVLSYQAKFENERRWLTYDILSGLFTADHPLWSYFIRLGITAEDLHFFVDNSCPPDIIGVNHYITSERFLDDNTEDYPIKTIGGNGIHQYADVEAIRIPLNEKHGITTLIQETWQRYKMPLAITEVHLNCSREDQLKWINHIYQSALKAAEEGINVIAVTAWALFGSFGWNRLLTGNFADCEYEAGAFDISAGYLRPTALSAFIKNIHSKSGLTENLLASPGWWQTESRYFVSEQRTCKNSVNTRRLLIIGKTGTLGKAFSKICTDRNLSNYLIGRAELDICKDAQLEAMIAHYNPWAIINTAGYVKVREAETNKDLCFRENYTGPQKLAICCEKHNIKLVTFSSDLVFDGMKRNPYVETDKANPVNVYGSSKQLAEECCLNENPSSLIIRTSAFFGPWDTFNFVYSTLAKLNLSMQMILPGHITVSPTYIPHLVHATLDLLIDNESGIWHLANKGHLTWYEFARKIAISQGFDAKLIQRTPLHNNASFALNTALSSVKYNLMPTLDQALIQYFLHTNFREHLKQNAKLL